MAHIDIHDSEDCLTPGVGHFISQGLQIVGASSESLQKPFWRWHRGPAPSFGQLADALKLSPDGRDVLVFAYLCVLPSVPGSLCRCEHDAAHAALVG